MEKSRRHKHKKEKHHKRTSMSSFTSSKSSNEWVEKLVSLKKPPEENSQKSCESSREEWMSLSSSFISVSNEARRNQREQNKKLERERAQYNPRECTRELNPYWKDGGDGLPKFQKPTDNDSGYSRIINSRPVPTSGWRKKASTKTSETLSKPDSSPTEMLSQAELNILASKLVKAEIMGKTKLVEELKQKLEAARSLQQEKPQNEKIILTQTDSQGHSRPLKQLSEEGEFSEGPRKKRKIETHTDGQRVRYFADDDKHSLQEMFENEKYNTVEDQNLEFIKMASKIRKNEDMDEIFADNIRKKESDSKTDVRNRDKAINDHKRLTQSIDSCKLCLQSEFMNKHLMVTLGDTTFITLPAQEPLTDGHCYIVPIRHATCSLLLDENEWSDVMDYRKLLTRMFLSKNKDIIFFETAKNLDKHPHMLIECVPLNKEDGDMAPIYFKKAIDECETEWAQNKKLVSLKGKDVRRAVPKGLPYFFVSFGMEEGYAHVIEDEKNFPNNFAHEIIGGMLDLHHSKWRKPKYQAFEEQSKRAVEFSKDYSEFENNST